MAIVLTAAVEWKTLCDKPIFTGYTVDGGYAEYLLWCAGTSCSRCPTVWMLPTSRRCCARGSSAFAACVSPGSNAGDRVGLFGFGSSASLTIAVLQAWKCEVYVSSRGEAHRKLATSLGATWVGSEHDKPPVELDRAITFAPSGEVVISALASLHKAGVVAINAIHLDRMPAFDYDKLLWGERQIRSVANSTRADARDFLKLAQEIGIHPRVASSNWSPGRSTCFPMAIGLLSVCSPKILWRRVRVVWKGSI